MTDKASVNVNVPIPSGYIKPTGTKVITGNGTGINVREFERVDVDVSPIGERGFYFTDFNAGRPHTFVVQGYTDGNTGFGNIFKTAANNPFNSVQTLKIKNCNGNCVFFAYTPTINRIEVYGINYSFGNNQAANCANITSVICYCNVTGINADAFNTDTAIALYDFSQNTEVALLANTRAVTHAEGCVIRVPQSLLAEWQAATNWNALTGVVWEGV